MKKTALWPGVAVVNSSNKKIVIQWKTLPDGTRMALLLGDNQDSVSGDDELGFVSALLAAAPAIFSMVKKVAPGLVSKGVELASKMLPGPAAAMLKNALAPAASSARASVKRIAAGRPARRATQKLMPGVTASQLQMLAPQRRQTSVRHLAHGAKVPSGYRSVQPVMKISDGAFVD